MTLKCKIRFRIKIKNIHDYFWIFFIIYSTDSLLFKTNENPLLRYISWALICIIGAEMALKYAYGKYYQEIYVVAIFLMLGMIINFDITGGYVFKILLLFCGLYLSQILPWSEFRKKFVNSMLVIAAGSLICYAFHSQLAEISFFPTISNGGVNFKCLILSNIPLLSYNEWTHYRNYGIFWEPGVYQAYLNIAIMLCIFGKKKINKKDFFKAGFLAIAVLSTLSTAGYIILALIVFAFLLKDGHIGWKSLVIIFSLVFITYALTQTDLSYYVFYKLKPHNASIASTNARIYSIFSNIYVALLHPVGTGPNGFIDLIYEFSRASFGIQSFAIVNTILLNFSVFGWFYGSYYILHLIDFVRTFNESWIVRALLLLVMILILFNESYLYSLMFSFIIFYHENGSKIHITLFQRTEQHRGVKEGKNENFMAM